MWMQITQHSSCTEGPKNAMRSVELLRSLPLHLQEIIRPVIQRNGYWLHPDTLLLAMAADDDPDIRAEAITRIKRCRQVPRCDGVREFRIPTVNFSASRYTQLSTGTQRKSQNLHSQPIYLMKRFMRF